MKDAYAFVLAGGVGDRLKPLTDVRAKPAVFMAGGNRLIDWVLSNLVNSEIRKIAALTMYNSNSLGNHLDLWKQRFRSPDFLRDYGPTFTDDQRRGYLHTADAVYQHLWEIKGKKVPPKKVFVLGSDHVYKMDYNEWREFHDKKKADLSVSGIPVDFNDPNNYQEEGGITRLKFGVFDVDSRGKVRGFYEKPEKDSPLFEKLQLKDRPGKVLASMGIYLFDTGKMVEVLETDAVNPASKHDFGKNIVPFMAGKDTPYTVYAYEYPSNSRATEWHDIGTMSVYHRINMDLIKDTHMGDLEWRIHSNKTGLPDARVSSNGQKGRAESSILCEGVVVNASRVTDSVIGPNVHIEGYDIKEHLNDSNFFNISESILFPGVEVGRNVIIRKAIIERDRIIPDGTVIGVSEEDDLARDIIIKGPEKIRYIPRTYVFEK